MSQRLEQLLELLHESPRDSFLLFAVAKEYESLQDDHHALEYYQTLVGTDPAYVGVYYHLGKLHERVGRTEEALATYEQGMTIARSQGDQHSYSELASAKLNLEYDE